MSKFILALLLTVPALWAYSQSYNSFEKKEFYQGKDTLRYRIQYPVDYNPAKKYPLVLVLHGSGERGSNNEAQLKWGGDLFSDSAKRVKYPAIILFPQCPRSGTWALSKATPGDSIRHMRTDTAASLALGLVMSLMDSLASTKTVDKKRIYVGGLSMGGMGTFDILWRKPHFFAAAFPICGAGDPAKVKIYARRFPIWVFHGGADPTVPVANSRLMVKTLTADKANVKYTEYPGVGHESWKNAFAEPDLFPWLFSQHR